MSPETLESFLALALGFAVAGLISAAYQAVTARPASFRLLNAQARPAALAALANPKPNWQGRVRKQEGAHGDLRA
jgi:hypothetical protein